ncbi:hypothetical protein L211DRAFT_838348 [Terfezia boudieri ATCC MYA-4762]|uniref:Uncharacterized protein n=1 Tax=Terfezia boudieri ATCC MYA-4762 TaxID=1051890 RepID=A0A3N4LLX7_9PEZI|nr:hypothetical protein L211DRAFT_838348 [Terfezia boudieri ATCC MYA-4762]
MTAASGDTSATLQSTQAEAAKPATNAHQVEEKTREATSGGQRKGKQKKNKKNKDNRAATTSIVDLAGGYQTSSNDVAGEDAKLVGPESIEAVGSGPNPIAELETKKESPGKKEDKKEHTRTMSGSGAVEVAPETFQAKKEIPIYKSTAKHEETKSVPTEISTFDAGPLAQAEETPSPAEIYETPNQPTASPSTTSSESAPITPTSPTATESHLGFSPAAIIPRAFQEEPPKHVFHEPNMMNPILNPIHPHQPGRITAEDLVHTVAALHHPPHQQPPHTQSNRLQIEPFLSPDASIRSPPKPNSPAPPLHVPGPGVTAGRIVMLANPPPPTGCLSPTRERRLTEYNIGHVHAGHTHRGHRLLGDNSYPAHSPYVISAETHPTGYKQNPLAAEWSGTALRKGPYGSGLDGRNNEDEVGEGERGGLFGRRRSTGATVSTTGYHRRGENVGLVASLVNLWEKSCNWFQEWVQATRW